ncbi:hypothetical protein ACEPPN_001080 [Leptodophora sp. 'Broadleaf-Isolate-01']
MDPLTAISLASSIVQFIDYSTKLIHGAKEIYGSVTGATEENYRLENVTAEMQTLSLKLLPRQDAQQTEDEQALSRLAAECKILSDQILALLKSIKPKDFNSKSQSVWAALKSKWNEREKQELEERLKNCQSQLELQSETKTKLEELAKIANEETIRLDVLQGHVRQLRRGVTVTEIGQRAQEQLRELLNLSEAACQAVAQQSILKALAFSDMYGRFEGVEKAHLNTFGWIYGDKPSPKADPDIVGFLHHDDSDDDQTLHEDSPTDRQPQHEDNTDTSSQILRSKEEEDVDFDESNNSRLKRSQDSVNAERKERETSSSTVPENQHQKDNQSDEDDASVQREKWTNWLSSGNGIFHIAGKLGSGKSTLMKFLCSHPQTKVALQKWADGLDEYEETGQEDYKSMVKLLHEWTALALDDVKICVSSREYNVFLNLFSTEKRLRLQELTAADMKRYIKDLLEEIEDQKGRENLIDAIVKKADGIFLWVAVVVKSLRERLEDGYDLPALEKELDTYPKELDPLFTHILKSMSRSAWQKVYQISALIDLLKSYELNLSLFSISFLENFENDPEFAMRDTFPFPSLDADSLRIRQDSMGKRLNGCCKGLLEIRVGETPTSTSAPIVTYTHRSVPEFLQTWKQGADTNLGLDKFNLEIDISQLILAELRATNDRPSNDNKILSLTVRSIIKMRALRSLDQAPFTFLEYLQSTLLEDNSSASDSWKYVIPIAANVSAWFGTGPRLFVTSPFLISVFLGQNSYSVWKIGKDYSSLVSNNSKFVTLLGLLYRSVDNSNYEVEPLESTVIADVHDQLLAQGMSPQTMLHKIYWGRCETLRDMTLWELFITTCIRISLPERVPPPVFLGLGQTIQKFLEHDADPNLTITCLKSQRNDQDLLVSDRDGDNEEQHDDDKDEGNVEVRYKARDWICHLNNVGDWFSPSEPMRKLIFETGKDREISLPELIKFWNFDNKVAILQLIDRKLRREECYTAESWKVNREQSQTQSGDGTTDLIVTEDRSAEDVPASRSTIGPQPSVPSKSVTNKGPLDSMAQSLWISHIMMFLLGK